MSTIWFAHKVVCKTFAIKSETKLYVKKQMKSKKEKKNSDVCPRRHRGFHWWETGDKIEEKNDNGLRERE